MSCELEPTTNDTDAIIWMWKSNTDPFDFAERAQWTQYSRTTSLTIEDAYNNGASSIVINEYYMIDLHHMLQINICDMNRQRPVNRCRSAENGMDEGSKRFTFSPCDIEGSTSKDNGKFQGCEFLLNWVVMCNHGESNPRFSGIFQSVCKGIQIEAQQLNIPNEKVKEIIDELEQLKIEVENKSERSSMKSLSKCCARIYTKDCFLHKLINLCLRKSDYSKSETLGPYCYLLYNHIGCHVRNSWLYRYNHRLRHIHMPSLTVYRGDFATEKRINEYKEAVGQKNKYFKWLIFVSTSKERIQAENFGVDIIYIINLTQADINDQYSDLTEISYFPNEKEVLLPPGVCFLIEDVTYDSQVNRHLITISIVPSCMWN